ncbi:TQO small subunit DoxA domain protein [Sulfolobus islandicus L.S.2.15]|uniref:TQO small subunit DoxA domain protein n=1 Tax=Saccharolobus islandicus (strain L.S.2.15 / Lassen \|nr:TQO small subunit DoxA domain-containing protein [Sulfolobus islandicus]ACP34910.1 TQO small subunit DoxA domain protein [Sulfolobus islandicus L.S.2.15]
MNGKVITIIAIIMILFSTGVTLGLYQINFKGLGNLTNYSKTPAYSLVGTRLYENGTLFLQVARTAGPDTYGGFIVLVQLLYPNGTVLYQWTGQQLGILPSSSIKNEFPLHPSKPIKIGNYGVGIEVPLGQNSTVILQLPHPISPGTYIIKVWDADGQSAAYGNKFQIIVKVDS